MSLESVKQAYQEWEIFESEPNKALKDEINEVFLHPNKESDEFFENVVSDCTPEGTDGFWVGIAIKYSHREGVNKTITLGYLESIISNWKKFWVVGGHISSAASMLGSIAPYPNQVLADAIEAERYNPDYEWGGEGNLDKISSNSLRAAAYGGYIMTATDYQTGFDAGQAIKASGKQPTVAMAEEFIAKWRKDHEKKAASR